MSKVVFGMFQDSLVIKVLPNSLTDSHSWKCSLQHGRGYTVNLLLLRRLTSSNAGPIDRRLQDGWTSYRVSVRVFWFYHSFWIVIVGYQARIR